MNSFGHNFRITTFGESHGPALGGVIDGMPSGIEIDLQAVQAELDRRRPGQSAITTARAEADKVQILSGLFQGKTTGTPIGFIIPNADQRSADYDAMQAAFRPSHADWTYSYKYGIRDHRGGGRSSARETACRVVAGAFAKQALARHGITIRAYTQQVGPIRLAVPYTALDLGAVDANDVRCPDAATAESMRALILEAKAQGDSLGGVVACVAQGVPAGLGCPVFGKLQAQLASAMLSINAAKGFDYGLGFDECHLRGSELIDAFEADGLRRIRPASNHSGGIQGGISNGEDIYFRVAFKPVATLLQPVPSANAQGQPATLAARGRHDPCVLPRAVPIVEAMAAIVILDNLLAPQ